jgi:hypothetical protein
MKRYRADVKAGHHLLSGLAPLLGPELIRQRLQDTWRLPDQLPGAQRRAQLAVLTAHLRSGEAIPDSEAATLVRNRFQETDIWPGAHDCANDAISLMIAAPRGRTFVAESPSFVSTATPGAQGA